MSDSFLYDKSLTKELLEDLKKCNSFLVWHNLASVAAELTHKFPIDQVATWLSGSTEILNIDKRKLLLDDRSTSIVFLRRLMKMDLYDASSRLTNGYEKPDIDEKQHGECHRYLFLYRLW